MIDKVSRAIALIITLIGVGTMWYWIFMQQHEAVYPKIFLMVFNTALCLSLVGLVYLFRVEGSKISRNMEFLVGTFLIAISSLTLLEYVFQSNFGIDELFVKVKISTGFRDSGRMSAMSATGFLTTGLALIIIKTMRTNAMFIISHLLILTIVYMALFGIIQNEIFEIASLKQAYNRLSTQTSFCLLLVCSLLWIDWYKKVHANNFEFSDANAANLVRLSILYFGAVVTFLIILIAFS